MEKTITKKENSMIEVPFDGKYSVKWAEEQLDKINIFSAELVAFARGQVFFEIKEHSKTYKDYTDVIKQLGYSQAQADGYINHLGKKDVLTYISEKFGQKITPRAAKHLPNDKKAAATIIKRANAFGKPTETNIIKAKAALGLGTGKHTEANAAERINAAQEKALAFKQWMIDNNEYTKESLIMDATIDMSGMSDFNQLAFEAVTQNYPGWKKFRKRALLKVHPDHGGSNEMLKLLMDLDAAVKCLYEHIESRERYDSYNSLKDKFNNEVYPATMALTDV